MRELREFREAHERFEAAGVALAGVSPDTLETHHWWSDRLKLRYPLLADPEHASARALGLTRRIGIAGWSVELFRRTTLLAGRDGRIAAVWGQVRVKGHAAEVLRAAAALAALPAPEAISRPDAPRPPAPPPA